MSNGMGHPLWSPAVPDCRERDKNITYERKRARAGKESRLNAAPAPRASPKIKEYLDISY